MKKQKTSHRPFRVLDYGLQQIVVDSNGNLVASVEGDRNKENAQLFSCAPELLKALKLMTGFHQSTIDSNPDHGYSKYAQQRVEAALLLVAKAEGKK